MIYSRSPYSIAQLKKFLILFLSYIPFFIHSQQPYYKRITAQKGLPSSTIYDLFCSSQGYVYLGLETGLSRFNGSKFILYPMVENKSRSVNAIQEDQQGKIWCMNFTNQLFFLEGDTLRPHALINEIIDNSGPLRDFVIHESGVYFLTEKELYLYTNENEIKLVTSIDTTHNGNSFVSLINSPNEEFIFILDIRNVYKLDKSGNIKVYSELPRKQCASAIHKDELVVSLKSSLKEFYLENRKIQNHVKFNRFYVNKIVSIGDDLWFCTNSGLSLFDLNSGGLNEFAFLNTRVTDIVQDFEGGYWVSSVDRGLFYVPDISTQFIKPSDYNVNAIEEGPNNSFFAGTGNGEIHHFSADGKLLRKIATHYNSEVEFLLYDSIQDRLISSHGLIDLKRSYLYKPVRFGKNIFSDSLGNLLINTYNQAVVLNKDLKSNPILPPSFESQNSFELFSSLSIPFYSLYQNRSNSGYYSPKENAYYIGAFDGLYKISNYNLKKELLFHGESTVVIGMTPSKRNKVWLSTQRHGVLLLNEDRVSSFVDKSMGLSSNTCRKIIERDGFLFVLTDIGLDMVNLLTKRVIRLTEIMSLSEITMYDFNISENKIRIAADVGVLIMDIPHNYKFYQPLIHQINFYSISDRVQTLINETNQLTNKSFKFEVEAINYENADIFQFSYRLIGFDSTWQVKESKDNLFNYIALSSGLYRFELRTKINDEYSPVKSIDFSIKKPFLESIWFYIIIMLSIISLAALIFRRLLVQQRKKQLIKQRLLQSQMISLRSQMNPHFLFNIVNSVQGLIYANKKTEASNLLGKMSMLMRCVLEVSDKPKISIHKELDILKNYVELEAARFEEDFKYSIKTKIPIEDQEILIPSLIIQPFIENAIKHGLMHKTGPKTLMIELNKKGDEWIEIIIEDNGIGREESQRINAKRVNHQSFASEAIESRITLINKANGENNITLKTEDLVDENKQAKGTRITIKINIHE